MNPRNLLFLYTLAAFLDIAITKFAIKNNLAYELNPLFSMLGEQRFWAIKAGGVGVVLVTFSGMLKNSPSAAYKGIVICCSMMILVVVWNIFNVVLSLGWMQ